MSLLISSEIIEEKMETCPRDQSFHVEIITFSMLIIPFLNEETDTRPIS